MPDVPEAALVDWIRACVSNLRDADGFTVDTFHADDFLLYDLICTHVWR